MTQLPSKSAEDLLASMGYDLVFREHGWVECLFSFEAERWTGQGTTREHACEDALRRMFPSSAARHLLSMALAEVAPEPAELPRAEPVDDAHAAPPSLPEESASPAPAAPLEPTLDVTLDLGGSVPLEDPPSFTPECPPANQEESSAPGTEASVDRGASTGDEYVAPEAPVVTGASEVLGAIQRAIDEQRVELGLASPERQRLEMLIWISRARACQEADSDKRVQDAVKSIARRLTDLGKAFWPGNVPALARDATPASTGASLTAWGAATSSWSEVADLAESQLQAIRSRDASAGLDDFGWVDAHDVRAAEPLADDLLARLALEVEDGCPFGRQPDRGAEPPSPAKVLDWVRRLRALRLRVADGHTWALVAGRLRFWSSTQARLFAEAREELEPAAAPRLTWKELSRREQAAREERERAQRAHEEQAERARELQLVRESVPDADAPDEVVLAWLARALPITDCWQQEIVDATRPLAGRMQALPADAIPGADRRIRRRFAKLKEAMSEPTAPSSKVRSVEDEPEAQSLEAPISSSLLPKVRAHTEGAVAAFVSNRRDELLRRELIEQFGFAELDWIESDPRRVEALAEAVAGGRHAFVLAAHGFLGHAVDVKLAALCKKVGALYVRVNHGRPGACVRALARDLGLLPEADQGQRVA